MKLYSTKQCGKCQILKKQLEENNIAFEYIDVHKDEKALDLLLSKNLSALPIVEKNGEFIENANYGLLA